MVYILEMTVIEVRKTAESYQAEHFIEYLGILQIQLKYISHTFYWSLALK